MTSDRNQLELDVWQFVRIMVALEDAAASKRHASAAYKAWREIWRELDERLSVLGKKDAASFAELMMEQQVVLPVPQPAVLRDTVETVEAVTRQMTKAIDQGDGDARHIADLRFERKELNALARRLARRVGQRVHERSSRKPPRSQQQKRDKKQ